MKFLGIDFGTRRVGLAVGDTETKLAVSLKTLFFDSRFWDELEKVAREEEIDEFVLGMPRSMKDAGEAGELARKVKEFKKELAARLSLPIHEEDERLSSAAADRFIKETGGDRDAVAASIILQSYLDHIRRNGNLKNSIN